MGQSFSLVLFIGVPVGQGFITGLLSQRHIKTWYFIRLAFELFCVRYKKLKKPNWTPKNWVFAPLGTTLFTCMGVASWLVWRKGGFVEQYVPLTLYAIQLTLASLWTPLFFNGHKVRLALLDALALVIASTATTCRFNDRSTTAGLLNAPFLAYSIFAATLNWKIAGDNPNADREGDEDPTQEQPSGSSHQRPSSGTAHNSVHGSASVTTEHTEHWRVVADAEETRRRN